MSKKSCVSSGGALKARFCKWRVLNGWVILLCIVSPKNKKNRNTDIYSDKEV